MSINIGSKNWTPQDIIDYALQFEGTHVTDYMINVYSLGTLVYPSDEFEDYVDKYHMTEQNGHVVDFKDLSYVKAAHMLRAINDSLNRYDCYGIELDFQREIRIFGIGAEYRGLDILNKFMRDVDDLISVYEEKYGHEIKTCVRVGSTIETNYEFGLDVKTWAAEGTIDLIIPTGRYESSDFDTPVTVWSSTMKPHGVEIAPCIEEHIRTYALDSAHSTRTSTLSTGFAANAFSQGADKIALYNYFLGSTTLGNDTKTINSDLYPVGNDAGAWNLLTTIGSYEKLMTRDRRCIMGYNDTNQIWHSSFSQLPFYGAKGTPGYIRVPVGDISDGATLTFKMSFNKEEFADTPPTVYVNSEPCKFVGIERCKGGFTTNKLLCYEIPAEAYHGTYMTAQITSLTSTLTAEYVEVYVDMAD